MPTIPMKKVAAAAPKQPIVRKASLGPAAKNKFVAPKPAAAPVKKAVVAPVRKPAIPARPVIAKKVAAK